MCCVCVCVCSLLPVAPPPPLEAHTDHSVFFYILQNVQLCALLFVCFVEALSYALHFPMCMMKIMIKSSTRVDSGVDFVNQSLKLRAAVVPAYLLRRIQAQRHTARHPSLLPAK